MNHRITSIYSDDQGNLTDRENAERVELTEYNENGIRIKTVYGRWAEVPTTEEIEHDMIDAFKENEIITEIEAGLVWNFTDDSKYIAQIYKKYRDFNEIEEVLENLYRCFFGCGFFLPVEKMGKLIELSRFFRENIKEKKAL